VRQGPGTNYDIITQLHDGDPLTLLGRNSTAEWLKVRLRDNTEGWVAAEFVAADVSLSRLAIVAAPPTPDRPAVDPRFRADRTTIAAGECTTLRWDADSIQAIYLDNQGVAGHGTRVVCPGNTQSYTLLVVQRDGRRVSWPLKITVSGTAATAEFVIDYRGCIGHQQRLGQVKGQVFDRNGNVIVNAYVEITVSGQSGVVPPGRTNEAGWYEWNLSPGQIARFVRLTVGGRIVPFAPSNFEVTATSGCYQRVDFRQR
jgi:hypothetical protein